MSGFLRRSLFGLAAAAPLFAATSAWAIKPFTLLEDGYPEGTGQLESENTFEYNWHPRSDNSSKELAAEHELEYGFNEHLTLRVAGAYVYSEAADERGNLHFDSFKIEAQYYFTNPNIDPIGVSVIASTNVQEREGAGFEGFLVFQKDTENWTFGYNLGFVTDVSNFYRGHDRETSGTLVNALGAVYSVTRQLRIGAEISAEMGYAEWRRYDNTNVYAGPVINFTPNDKLWITFGLDYQITNHADEPQYRAALIIGYYF